MEYFSTKELRTADKQGTTTKGPYHTRSVIDSNSVYGISTEGNIAQVRKNAQQHLRPAIVLPYDTAVVNTEYESSPAVKLHDDTGGIYVFADGKWKECKA